MARKAKAVKRVRLRFICQTFNLSTTNYRYESKRGSENENIADWLVRLTTTHKRWGFGLCFMYLHNTKGYGWNHKRVYRIYRQLELNLHIKPKRRIKRDKPDALQVPQQVNQIWSMDFMSDSLIDGRALRTFNGVDDYNREGLGIEVDLSLPSTRVIRSLENIIEWRGKPDALGCDNGPEYISQKLIGWASERHITLMYTQLASPRKMLTLNALTEPQGMNGWICIYLNRLSTLRAWRPSGFGLTITCDLILPLAVFRLDG